MITHTLDRETGMRMYAAVSIAVACDTKMWSLLNSAQISLFYLSSRGHEIVSAAAGCTLEAEDYLITYYRGLPEQIAKGISLSGVWAEWCGKVTGNCHGKGGSVHMIDPDANIMVNSGIVGGQFPIAAGFGLASKMRNDGRVTMCTFGDGANTEGTFHEALNLAALWNLPVVFLCQNNRYAESTAFAKQTCVERVALRAAAYGIPGITFDGNNAAEAYSVIRTAVERARNGGGPSLVEGMTYRLMGHYNLDSMSYMPAEELKAAREADPVPIFRNMLVSSGLASEAELRQIDEHSRAAVEDAWQFAKNSPAPDEAELLSDVLGGV